jgi:Asp/Glu/hydantoin racemase
MKILIANPNTSRAMLDLMVQEARQASRPGTEITGIAADIGVSYISTRSEMAIAGYALLDSLARHHAGHDAIIVGAFYHALVPAAKELMPLPVIGLAEAGMRAAQLLGTRIGLIGIGAPARAMASDLLAGLHMEGVTVCTRPLSLTGTALVEDQAGAEAAVVELGLAAVREDHADVLVLGGAAFAGMAPRLTERLPVPVVSPMHYAVGYAELAVLSGWRKPTTGAYGPPDAKPTTGLGPELARLFPAPPG